jgi:hypothetical protein
MLSARLTEQYQQQLLQLQPHQRNKLLLHLHLLRQPHPNQQQQQQQRGQLPPDQQVELDNSLNSLALSALHMWLLLCNGGSSSSSCDVTTNAAGTSANPAAVYVRVGAEYAHVAGYVAQAFASWPMQQAELDAGSSTAGAANNSRNSSNSSNRQLVRYGNVVLPPLPFLDVTHALPVAFQLMRTVSLAMEAVQHYNGDMMQQEAQALSEKLSETRAALADPSVLELQLLLLACLAKLRHQQLAVTQQGCSLVHDMSQKSWRQQLKLPAAHQDLLSKYALHEVDLAQLAQQQQQQQQRTATAQYVRCVTPSTLSASVCLMLAILIRTAFVVLNIFMCPDWPRCRLLLTLNSLLSDLHAQGSALHADTVSYV